MIHFFKCHKYNGFWFLQGFDEIILLCLFYTMNFHFRFRKISQNKILCRILDVYPHINFINKILSVVQKILYGALIKSHSVGDYWLLMRPEVHERIVFKIDNIIVFLYPWLYNILWVVLSFHIL